jgi:multisubunit Na+/H+ antiporter MnhG subunit
MNGGVTFGLSLVVVGLILIVLASIGLVKANYEWERDFGSHWSLADKASTIPQKAKHIDDFVNALEAADLAGTHNAAVFPTLDNSFDANLIALKTLRSRLQEMQTMDVTGFAYQTAIQQVTEQEQGEAQKMIDVFSGAWRKKHHPTIWDWWGALFVLGYILLIVMGINIALYAESKGRRRRMQRY